MKTNITSALIGLIIAIVPIIYFDFSDPLVTRIICAGITWIGASFFLYGLSILFEKNDNNFINVKKEIMTSAYEIDLEIDFEDYDGINIDVLDSIKGKVNFDIYITENYIDGFLEGEYIEKVNWDRTLYTAEQNMVIWDFVELTDFFKYADDEHLKT